MRILVCGSRNYADKEAMAEVVSRFPADAVVITGTARGADTLAFQAAKARGLVNETYSADWAKWGKRAGPMRNQRMLDEGKPDHVIAFPLADSVGTWDMIRRARKAGIPVEIQD